MTKLAQKLTEKISVLPDEEQDIIAGCILDLLEGSTDKEESEWDKLTNSPESLKWLEDQAKKVLGNTDEIYDFDPSNMPQ